MIQKPPRSFTIAQRLEFYSRIEPISGCRLWHGPLHYKGYGQIYWEGRTWPAHGPIAGSLCLCHKCDVRACINTDHLFVGTKADNNRDMFAKGRNVNHRGVGVYTARLSDEIVRAMRLSTESDETWGSRLGVAQSTVNQARSGRTWAHVAMAPE